MKLSPDFKTAIGATLAFALIYPPKCTVEAQEDNPLEQRVQLNYQDVNEGKDHYGVSNLSLYESRLEKRKR
tara:strand:+ start:869 stop:1081 length:213 start_codon:yes stop_codon:yes gene_type:complete